MRFECIMNEMKLFPRFSQSGGYHLSKSCVCVCAAGILRINVAGIICVPNMMKLKKDKHHIAQY